LPDKFDVERKDWGKKYLDTPLRPSAPKGAVHFFADKPELFALSLGDSTELNRIVNISSDGVRSVLHSVKPAMTISVSDLRISSEQLFWYVVSEQPPVQATPVRKHKTRTNLLDAPIQRAIKLAGSLETAAVFVQLRELALDETPPFTGVVENGELRYTNDKDVVVALTKANLARRLKNHSL